MTTTPIRAHVIAGGYPPGLHAGHDMDFARMRILQALQSNENVQATVSNDFTDWLLRAVFLHLPSSHLVTHQQAWWAASASDAIDPGTPLFEV